MSLAQLIDHPFQSSAERHFICFLALADDRGERAQTGADVNLGQREMPLAKKQSPPPLLEVMPLTRGRVEYKTDGRSGSLARRKGWPCGSRTQSPPANGSASGTPCIDSQHWPETTAWHLVGRKLDVRVMSMPPEAAADHFGALYFVVAADNPASNARTHERLGWRPEQTRLLGDLDGSHYFQDGASRAVGASLQPFRRASESFARDRIDPELAEALAVVPRGPPGICDLSNSIGYPGRRARAGDGAGRADTR